ncbi:alpha/beta-hydrolase [Thozetella sp. PMI_491]|nr:alpha/beta-hydrolase [Thozetella sp. PMI_491]
MLNTAALGLVSQAALQSAWGSQRGASFYNSAPTPHRQLDDSICPAHVDHFTGSISLSHGKELFYWLFSSASDPENDPLLVWLTGQNILHSGPGGASTLAAVTEVGPCFVNVTDNSTYHNPHHWAQHANLLILDQPAGVGFSKASADPEHKVKTLEAATEDFVDFMHHFVTDLFPQLSTNELHIAGESYGGRWAPAFMHALASLADVQSTRAIPNPLGSIILVNAVIGTLGGQLATANYDFGCTPDGVATKLGIGYNSTVCSVIQELGPECEYYGNLCEFTNSISVCKDASAFCEGKIAPLTRIPSRSMYNVAQLCTNPEKLCLPAWDATMSFYENPVLRKAMGINSQFIWSPVSFDIEQDFEASGAISQSVIPQVRSLLDSYKVRILVMNGDLDALVVSSGQARIFDNLPWHGQLDYRQQAWRNWSMQDSKGSISGGQIKNSTLLKFVRFENAGHMVPGDDPLGAATVLEEWLKN